MLPSCPFLLLRHGQTDWNLEGRFQGHTDIALNATGLAQAQAAAQRLTGHSVTAIVSSPLVRASKTAAIVAERLGCPVHIDRQLTERTFGHLEGLVVRDVKKQLGLRPEERMADRNALPADAEQWPQTLERTRTAVAIWLNKFPSETLLFVAHTGLFEALCHQLCGHRFEGKHATPYRFSPVDNSWQVEEIG